MRTSTRTSNHRHGSRDPRRAERLAVIAAKGKGIR